MRLGAVPDSFLDRIAAWFNLAPKPLLDSHIAFLLARTVMSGAALGVFDAVGNGPATAEEIAATCETDPRATGKLLRALACCGYLECNGDRFSLTPIARKWLLSDSETTVHNKLMLQFFEWNMMSNYEDFVRTGKPIDLHGTLKDDRDWKLYQRGMRDMAGLAAKDLVSHFPVPKDARDMLDIGGSHGFHAVSLCRKHPDLRAVILELPEAIPQAAPLLAREDMGDRVTHRAGNALTEDLGESCLDIVLLSQIVHHFSDAENRALAARIARALRPAGVCVIFDTIQPSSLKEAGQMGALLDLYFAMTSLSGTWPIESMHEWYRAAGLAPKKPISLVSSPGAAMVVGVKPA